MNETIGLIALVGLWMLIVAYRACGRISNTSFLCYYQDPQTSQALYAKELYYKLENRSYMIYRVLNYF